MKTAIYIRVSSDSQITDSQDSEIAKWQEREQVPADACERYVDQGVTGTKMARPAMRRLMTDVALKKVQKIVIWRMDRLGRTAAGLTSLFEDLTKHGVTLVSIRDGFDLDTPSGRLMANVLASVSQFETEVRRERQMAGMEAAKARGVFKGRKPGSTEVKYGPKKARRMKERGLTLKEIAAALGCSERTVTNYLQVSGYYERLIVKPEESNGERPQ